VLGAVADIPDNGIALTAYDASTNGQDLSAQVRAGLAFSLNDMQIQRIEWLFDSVRLGLDASLALDPSGIAVVFSAAALARSPSRAAGSDEIDFGTRVTCNHALAVDTVVIGGGVSEFRPLLLPNGASVNGVAAPPRASSVPFRAPALAAPAALIRLSARRRATPRTPPATAGRPLATAMATACTAW